MGHSYVYEDGRLVCTLWTNPDYEFVVDNLQEYLKTNSWVKIFNGLTFEHKATFMPMMGQ